jgi:hypothetical protein
MLAQGFAEVQSFFIPPRSACISGPMAKQPFADSEIGAPVQWEEAIPGQIQPQKRAEPQFRVITEMKRAELELCAPQPHSFQPER